jgi:hypothetical protein
MPVILENGSEELYTWLDPGRNKWSKELQSLLKPFSGELECYVVSKDVGKVGNNSPNFIVPVTSLENRSNIANFFANAKQPAKDVHNSISSSQDNKRAVKVEVTSDDDDDRHTINPPRSEDNAPMPLQKSTSPSRGTKRSRNDIGNGDILAEDDIEIKLPPTKSRTLNSSKRIKSSTSNDTALRINSNKSRNQRITNFFPA